ncbi:MAG: rubrerythrin, partial [bacterium]|nr:rubrerythrin [bacterium]
EEEAKHKDFLLNVKKGAAIKVSPGEIADLKISDYIKEVKVTADMNYQEALTVAMHREKMAFKLYTRLSGMVADPEMQETFQLLARQEAKHKLRLELIYDDEILTEN